jgi:hypothetical protein
MLHDGETTNDTNVVRVIRVIRGESSGPRHPAGLAVRLGTKFYTLASERQLGVGAQGDAKHHFCRP